MPVYLKRKICDLNFERIFFSLDDKIDYQNNNQSTKRIVKNILVDRGQKLSQTLLCSAICVTLETSFTVSQLGNTTKRI